MPPADIDKPSETQIRHRNARSTCRCLENPIDPLLEVDYGGVFWKYLACHYIVYPTPSQGQQCQFISNKSDIYGLTLTQNCLLNIESFCCFSWKRGGEGLVCMPVCDCAVVRYITCIHRNILSLPCQILWMVKSCASMNEVVVIHLLTQYLRVILKRLITKPGWLKHEPDIILHHIINNTFFTPRTSTRNIAPVLVFYVVNPVPFVVVICPKHFPVSRGLFQYKDAVSPLLKRVP